MSDGNGLVVVIEDDPTIAEVERLYLGEAGFGVHVSTDGPSGLSAIRSFSPVAAVIDVGLPVFDGVEVCRRLRAADDWTPVVFVTARDSEVDRVLGIELGGDDYLTKPFSPRELAARVKGLVRRSRVAGRATVLRLGRVSLDTGARTVRSDAGEMGLTATEFDLLAYLMASPGQVFARSQLLSAVWGAADYSGSRTVDVHVAQLRAKLAGALSIRTVRGVGYAIESP